MILVSVSFRTPTRRSPGPDFPGPGLWHEMRTGLS